MFIQIYYSKITSFFIIYIKASIMYLPTHPKLNIKHFNHYIKSQSL